jgi:hypothetical protein
MLMMAKLFIVGADTKAASAGLMSYYYVSTNRYIAGICLLMQNVQ